MPRRPSSIRLLSLFWLLALLAGVVACVAIVAGCSGRRADWLLTELTGHLPDLQFTLQSADNAALTAADFRGDVTLVFFGYAHCPDICPTTMARLGQVVGRLGPDAQRVRILFVSVDPRRDTPAMLRDYARAFSPQAIGATGTPAQIESLAKRYRVAYQADPPDANGDYEVMHGKAIYVFDGAGRARLMITDRDSPDAIVHDLKELVRGATS